MELQSTVLQVIPRLDAGGAERTTVDIAWAIVKAGGRALVATSGGRLCDDVRDVGGFIVEAPFESKNPLVMWRNRGLLRKTIRSFDVDIVHARSRAPAWSALWAARAEGVPFVTTYHGVYSAKGSAKRFYNSVMARGDVVIANSEYTRAHVMAEHGIAPEKIFTIYRGVDLERFSPNAVAPNRVAALREAWGVEEDADPMVVLLPGRLTQWKGQSVLIEAAKRLKASGQGGAFKCILAGDAQGRDGYEQALRSQIGQSGVGDMVEMVGHCSDMPAAYAVSDVVISASTRPEAFGRVAAEAQAMARPVIATDHGGAQEPVEPDVTGWLTPPGDAQALADAISAFTRMSPRGRSYMGVEARRRIIEKFSLDVMTRDTLAIYDQLSGGRG